MGFAKRMLKTSGQAAAIAAAVPALTAAALATPAYIPIWGLAHWILKNDVDHKDTPALLFKSAWLATAPVRAAVSAFAANTQPHPKRLAKVVISTATAGVQTGLLLWFLNHSANAGYPPGPDPAWVLLLSAGICASTLVPISLLTAMLIISFEGPSRDED